MFAKNVRGANENVENGDKLCKASHFQKNAALAKNTINHYNTLVEILGRTEFKKKEIRNIQHKFCRNDFTKPKVCILGTSPPKPRNKQKRNAENVENANIKMAKVPKDQVTPTIPAKFYIWQE